LSTVVVAGAGLSGLRTAQQLRRRGFSGQIVIVGAEPHMPYARPPLSKDMLTGTQGIPTLLRPRELADVDADWRLDNPACGLDVGHRIVTTCRDEIPYDTLVVATGARPRRLPGLNGFVLRTWEDACALRAAIKPGTVVAIVGAGLIGCEVAASMTKAGAQVHLVDVATSPMIRVVGKEVGTFVNRLHRANGVQLHMDGSATVREGRLVRDGRDDIRVDVVVEAVGIVPNIEWLHRSGLALADGLLCDDAGRTSDPHVFSVGDVAAWQGRRNEHWTSATEQAAKVAAAITSEPGSGEGVSYWWSDQYGTRIQGLGDITNADVVHMFEPGEPGKLIALYGHMGQLTGAVGFSAARHLMKLRSDIARGTCLSEVLKGMPGPTLPM
jgi:3-phenylpropionate/trans-cinnamate dioxygenase ferredoxin reductase component